MHPRLFLGLVGFDTHERGAVHDFLQMHAQLARSREDDEKLTYPVWEVVDYSHADALLVSGRAVVQSHDNVLYFQRSQDDGVQLQHDALGSEADVYISEPVAVNLEELGLPCALIHRQSLIEEGIILATNYPAVNLQTPGSLLAALRHFEGILRPLRSMCALACAMTERHHELDAEHTYHLESNGVLQMILDIPQRRVLIRPGVRPVDIETIAWMRRPKSANFAPQDFLTCTFEEVAWEFALHSPRLNLPSRYQRKPIYLRRLPQVRPSMYCERHNILFDLLSAKPSSFAELTSLLGSNAVFLERDLFALYLCRAITTTPIKGVPSSLPPGSDFEAVTKKFPYDPNSGLHEAPIFDRLGRSLNTVPATLDRIPGA